MSMRTLPLVVINLGGEMLYILDQRLRAHNTHEDNAEKGVWSETDRKRVMNDIVGTMFSKAFMDELLKPQQLYSHRTLKTVLSRLAHASIMRLNPASMDRLYELMIMAFKYQVVLCPRPKDLLLISYNHIDAIREFVKDTPAAVNQVDEAHRKISEGYSSLTEGEFQLLRQTLLIFFQDMHVRVSLFLQNQIQKPNGRFALSTSGPVPQGTTVPGLIRFYHELHQDAGLDSSLDEQTFGCKGSEVRQFPTEGSYSGPAKEGSFGLHGDRVIRLGMNMYTVNHPEETYTSRGPCVKTDDGPNLLAKEELNLLARLMGNMKAEDMSAAQIPFRINLFASDQEEDEAGASGEAADFLFGVINIQAIQDEETSTHLAQIAGQFAEGETQLENLQNNKGDELLAMMDDL